MSLLGRNSGNAYDSNNLRPDDVMNVASGAVTPWNPGDNSEIRTKPVVTKHRNFSKQEADELRVGAAGKTRQAKVNRQAYKSLRTIERADTSDHTAFRGYQTTVAGATAAKKGADVAKAKTLYGLTGKYAGMGYSLGAAHDEAQVRVREYQALHTEVDNRWK